VLPGPEPEAGGSTDLQDADRRCDDLDREETDAVARRFGWRCRCRFDRFGRGRAPRRRTGCGGRPARAPRRDVREHLLELGIDGVDRAHLRGAAQAPLVRGDVSG
jgi:hypothetical protein